MAKLYRCECKISIHAPAKGATRYRRRIAPDIQISIHAPAKGATIVCDGSRNWSWNFNPRSREGSDYGQGSVTDLYRHFNPRSREGSDPNIIQYKTINSKIFQTI